MSMTRKDYEAIALTLRRHRPPNSDGPTPTSYCICTWQEVVEALADLFAHHNPRFDRNRFLTACDYQDEDIPF